MSTPSISPQSDRQTTKPRQRRRWPWLAPAAVALSAAGLLAVMGFADSQQETDGNHSVFATKQGPLTISVLATGDLSSQEATVIRNELEDDTTMLTLVDQGTVVEKGDVIAELDATAFKDEKEQLLIDIEDARAAKVKAENQLEIVKQQNAAAKLAAEVNLQLAKLDFRKYLGAPAEQINSSKSKVMQRIRKLNDISSTQDPNYDQRMQQILSNIEGQYKQKVQSALNAIRVAKAEFERAKERVAGSRNLSEKGYITETELDADILEQTRLESELQQARGDLRLLRRFTFQRELANLRNQLKQQQFTLKQAKAEARSKLVEAEATLKSRKSKLGLLQSRLKEVKSQIAACTIRAPKDGVVVYVKPDQEWDEMVSQGAEIDDRQKLFRLPSSEEMVATVDLHQSVVNKVEPGMSARVTSNGIDNTFSGKVRRVNRLPDTDSSQRASNEKIYKCEIVVDSDGQLRPGMSVKAEIIVQDFESATYVPIQSVVQRAGRPTVFLPGPSGPQPKAVEIGLDNNEMVRITGGLEPGQEVLLTPPLGGDDNDKGSEEKQPAIARTPEAKRASGDS